jgi:predicted ATPase/DNA-binding CsgD family transcriptional regulator
MARGSLPAELTEFIGRTVELRDLDVLLRASRLVTVTGPGGVGKTRLALHISSGIEAEFPDGVYLIELSGLRDPELLAHTVAAGLGLPEQDPRPRVDAVLDYLRDRHLLLILDTCEHLLDACARLTEAIAAHAPQVTILATSRQPLDIPGEHTYPVPPMPVTAGGDRDPGDAVRLFTQRATDAAPQFTLTKQNTADVIAVCHRLDGIPLAIELAAIRLRALPLHTLLELLEYRFRVLATGRRSGIPRHKTLRTAIEWSHDLCSEPERDLWARLSVFAESFDLRAAGEVCSAGDVAQDQIVQSLIGLVDKSIVLRSDEGGVTRYRLLDTLREFGAEQLVASGAESVCRDRHIARYLAMATHFDGHFLDDDQTRRFHELRREHANLRAALEYALAKPGGESDAAALVTSLDGYWQVSGLLREGGYWLTKVLERFPGPSPERALALAVRCHVRTHQGEIAQAIRDGQESIEAADASGAELAAARGWLFLNLAVTFAGRHDEALTTGAEAERRLTALGDTYGLGLLHIHMGFLHALSGDRALSLEWSADGLALLGDDTGERWIQSYLHLTRGLAFFLQPGQEAECAAAVISGMRMKHELGDIVGIGYGLELMAWLAVGAGRFERASALLGAADPLWERAGNRLGSNPILEEIHVRMAKAATDALGTQQYAALYASGAAQPLDRVIAFATDSEADELTAGGSQQASLLTSRETEIATLVAEGLSNREIAEKLVISKRTVDAHMEHIFAKLRVSSRQHIAALLEDS